MISSFTFLSIVILVLKTRSYLDENNLKFKKKSSRLDFIIALLEILLMCIVPFLNFVCLCLFIVCIINFDEFIGELQDRFEEI